MKKIILFSLLVFNTHTSFSQMGLFQHLNEIKDDSNPGFLEKIDDKDDYVYYVKDDSTSTVYGYILTQKLYCYMTVVKPMTTYSLQTWVQILNQQWVIKNDFNWLFYRSDGDILQCELKNINGESAFIFSVKKIKKK